MGSQLGSLRPKEWAARLVLYCSAAALAACSAALRSASPPKGTCMLKLLRGGPGCPTRRQRWSNGGPVGAGSIHG